MAAAFDFPPHSCDVPIWIVLSNTLGSRAVQLRWATDTSSLSSCHHVKVVVKDIGAQSILASRYTTRPNTLTPTDTEQQGNEKTQVSTPASSPRSVSTTRTKTMA